jgi:hypothetical protein
VGDVRANAADQERSGSSWRIGGRIETHMPLE